MRYDADVVADVNESIFPDDANILVVFIKLASMLFALRSSMLNV